MLRYFFRIRSDAAGAGSKTETLVPAARVVERETNSIFSPSRAAESTACAVFSSSGEQYLLRY